MLNFYVLWQSQSVGYKIVSLTIHVKTNTKIGSRYKTNDNYFVGF